MHDYYPEEKHHREQFAQLTSGLLSYIRNNKVSFKDALLPFSRMIAKNKPKSATIFYRMMGKIHNDNLPQGGL